MHNIEKKHKKKKEKGREILLYLGVVSMAQWDNTYTYK